MGLDCSHDAWEGAYSAFNAFRQVVCRAFGGSYPPHPKNAFNEGVLITRDPLPVLDDHYIYFSPPGTEVDVPDGLLEFLTHSDCDGTIAPEMCSKVADALEALLPKIAAQTGTPWSGHVSHYGGYEEVTKRFIAGCRRAAKAGEPLEFY